MDAAEIRAVQLDVLRDLDALCRAHGLRCYLAYGTLLGAARHGGFVPWDDDVDVMLPRDDYDRLLALFAEAAPEHLVLDAPGTQHHWPLPYAKVGDRRTEVTEPLESPVELGVNVDVFPVDGVPERWLPALLQARLLQVLGELVELAYLTADRARLWHRPAAVRFGKPLLRRVGLHQLVGWTDRVARWAPPSTRRVGVRVGSFDWSVPRAALGEPVEVRFEHLTVRAPADTDQVLTRLYGDWRRLPPESERASHHAFTARWRDGRPGQ